MKVFTDGIKQDLAGIMKGFKKDVHSWLTDMQAQITELKQEIKLMEMETSNPNPPGLQPSQQLGQRATILVERAAR